MYIIKHAPVIKYTNYIIHTPTLYHPVLSDAGQAATLTPFAIYGDEQ